MPEPEILIDRWGFPLSPAQLRLLQQRILAAEKQANPPVPKIRRGSATDRNFLSGLRHLCRIRREGQTFNSYEIATATQTSHTHIENLTRSGLRKMRGRLPPEIRTAFEHLLKP